MQPPIQEKLEEFYRLAHERQLVWYRRQQGLQAPWTDDPVFREWKFTNVFRELDAGTVFLIRMLEHDALGTGPADLVFNIWFYRELNNIESWSEVTEGRFVQPTEAVQRGLLGNMEARRLGGRPVFTNAHMAPSYKAVAEAMPIVAKVSGALARRLEKTSDLRDVYEHMRCLPAVSNFLAYQLAQDMTYADPPLTAADTEEWALAGPGVLSALETLYGRRVTPGEAVHCMKQIRDLQDEVFQRLGLEFSAVAHPKYARVGLSAVEHWLCEYTKYHRIAHEGGSGKIRYRA